MDLTIYECLNIILNEFNFSVSLELEKMTTTNGFEAATLRYFGPPSQKV